MNPEQFHRLQQLFHGAAGLPENERRSYLENAAGGDPALIEEALLLLANGPSEDDTWVQGVRAAAEAMVDDGEVGPRVGPYRILRQLGHGGMGLVSLAVRDDDAYRKRVAIKVASGHAGHERNRFLQERRILAALDHPSIARLLDGGTTESGHPYLVMEYVEGEPIDLYCDRHGLEVRARLSLFRQVCEAVHYAHQSLIVHRDLKPANILVTASGEPKLLDFGIAKLLAPDLVDAPPLTGTGAIPMTLEYASPEQIRGGLVTTATDVYSLGIVLYELLVGRPPFRLREHSAVELLRLIGEVEPDAPSTALLKTSDPTPDRIARDRGLDPAGLRRQLRGDLDNIVMKAIRKVPSGRYTSAHQLAEDIHRYLAGEPILARAPTLGYVARKFVGKHRVGVAAAAAFVVLAAGFTVKQARLTSELAEERDLARQDAAMAQRTTTFLQDLFRAADPAKADSITARELLDRAVEHARLELEDEPPVEATLFDTLGGVYASLGLYDKATPLLEDALKIRQLSFGAESLEAAASLQTLGDVQRERALYAAAEASLREAVRLREKLLPADDPVLAASLHGLGVVERDVGHYSEAERLYRRALAIREGRRGEEAGLGETAERLAQVLQDGWRSDEALSMAGRAVAVNRSLGSIADAGLARALDRLGLIRRDRGELRDAETATTEALKLRRELFGPEHPNVAVSMAELASVLAERGEFTAAEKLDRDALDVLSRSLGANHPNVAAVQLTLADILDRTARSEAAARLARSALDIRSARLGPDHPLTLRASESWLRIRSGLGFAESEAGLDAVLTQRRRALPPGHPDVAESLLDLSAARERRGETKDCAPPARDALAILVGALPPEHWRIAQARSTLGGCLAALGHSNEAERLLVQATSVLEQRPGHRREARQAGERLARLRKK
jgi:serine/threonine-protein kinase